MNLKRIWSLLLALIMVFGLIGCGDTAVDVLETAVETMEIIEAVTEETSDEEAEAPSMEEEAPAEELIEETAPETTEEAEPEQEEIPAETEVPEEAPVEEEESIAEDGWYYSAGDVSLYLYTYGYLPGNFITKNEARDLGWEGGSVEDYAPGCAIGGDKFGNREGILPRADGRQYYECDIDTDGENSRGAKRIVFSNDGLIYYTEDHYETFTLLYGEE